jgi:ABC-type transport system involved in cytochrome c biogenesis permease subunit
VDNIFLVSVQVSQPYSVIGLMTVLYVLIFVLLNRVSQGESSIMYLCPIPKGVVYGDMSYGESFYKLIHIYGNCYT